MLVIVTGASSNHFRSLKQFLDTARHHRSDTDIIYAYDLGLDENENRELKESYGDIKVVKFDFSTHPDYFDISKEAGHWAWKPALLREVARKHPGERMLWCDAGNRILVGTHIISDFIGKVRLYSPVSAGSVADWTFPAVLKGFDFKEVWLPNRNGAILGFDLSDADVATLLEAYNHYAHIKEAIAPEGSNRQNHRQDQSLFTILFYTLWRRKRFPIFNHYFGVSIHNDIEPEPPCHPKS